jgi:hypothetical protein
MQAIQFMGVQIHFWAPVLFRPIVVSLLVNEVADIP